jgi:hypothetical protein
LGLLFFEALAQLADLAIAGILWRGGLGRDGGSQARQEKRA